MLECVHVIGYYDSSCETKAIGFICLKQLVGWCHQLHLPLPSRNMWWYRLHLPQPPSYSVTKLFATDHVCAACMLKRLLACSVVASDGTALFQVLALCIYYYLLKHLSTALCIY